MNTTGRSPVGIPFLNNLSFKLTHRLADIRYRYRNSKSQSAGGVNCENAKQGASEEKGTKTGCRKSVQNTYISAHVI
jgi:hypothetical protein